MNFLGIGGAEVLFVMLIVLLVFGPKKLPQIARTIGQTTKKMREASSQLAKEMSQEMKGTEDIKTEISDLVQKAISPSDESGKPKGTESKPVQPVQKE